jgi:CheY-like chemotaxis protein
VDPSPQLEILILGNDPVLAYLIGRYARQSGYGIIARQAIPQAAEVCDQRPAAILFTSVEYLESVQELIAGLANCEIPVLVCASVADEARARELGADHCLLNPLTYENFHDVLAAIATMAGTRRSKLHYLPIRIEEDPMPGRKA